MASREDLKEGQRVSFLRSHNKAVRLEGTVVGISPDEPVAAVKLDDHDPVWIETAHLDDITILDGDTAPAFGTPSAPGTSFVKVNNKAI